MKASEASLLHFLRTSPQFVIPIYQRTYSWTEKECEQLWSDVIRAGANKESTAHFVGSVVYIEKGIYQVSNQTPLLVIDGQQRLTTVTLLLEALCRHLGDEEPIEGFSAKKLRHYHLLNPLEDGEKAFKLLLTQTDRETLNAIVQQRALPDENSVRVAQNFNYFTKKVKALHGDLEDLCLGLKKLVIVDVALNREQDNPQLIFESMNSTGRELSQADLIRNYVLMGLEPKHQTALYENHWHPMEKRFGQESYTSYFDAFIRHYLTVKTGEIPNVRAVYEAFKAYSHRPNVASAGVDAIVKDVEKYAGYYCSMALGQEKDPKLKEAFQDLRDLRVDVAYPLLLELYYDYSNEILTKDEFLAGLRLIESYVFRRAICAIPTNSMNKTFANLSKSLNKGKYLESLQAAFQLLPTYRRFPNDEEFRREIENRDMYNIPRRSFWLRRLENHGRKERVHVDEYTIEHIMPQNPNLSEEWIHVLGPEWETIHESKLHTLGNLTLTGYNSEYSDRSFSEKRDMKGGFHESPLRLNRGLAKIDRWDLAQIEIRASALSATALDVWVRPDLSDAALSSYRAQPKTNGNGGYTLADHAHLSAGKPMRALFEELRKQLLNMDPNISEEIMKLYIAYKAETNVVDIVPQMVRLRLSLNMPFPELNDTRGIAKDVTNLGRWGNGDVEVGLENADDIPYVLSLVRQSLDRQLSKGTLNDE